MVSYVCICHTCMFGFGEASRGWTLHQIVEVWIPSILSGFLGYVIFGDDIHIDPHKVQPIVDWATLDLFEMSNVFFNLLIFIDISLPTII
jgi:hypothetical protein